MHVAPTQPPINVIILELIKRKDEEKDSSTNERRLRHRVMAWCGTGMHHPEDTSKAGTNKTVPSAVFNVKWEGDKTLN